MPELEVLEKVVKRLAEIMRTQDWNINIKVKNKYECAEEYDKVNTTTYGYVHTIICFKQADIVLNKDKNPNEWYITLAHEMKHIQLADMSSEINKIIGDKKFDELTYFEQLTEILAKEFVSLYPEEKILKDIKEMGKK